MKWMVILLMWPAMAGAQIGIKALPFVQRSLLLGKADFKNGIFQQQSGGAVADVSFAPNSFFGSSTGIGCRFRKADSSNGFSFAIGANYNRYVIDYDYKIKVAGNQQISNGTLKSEYIEIRPMVGNLMVTKQGVSATFGAGVAYHAHLTDGYKNYLTTEVEFGIGCRGALLTAGASIGNDHIDAERMVNNSPATLNIRPGAYRVGIVFYPLLFKYRHSASKEG